MTKLIVLLVFAVATLALPPALSHSHRKKGLEVVHPWTPAMVQNDVRTTQVFMTIKNRGRTDDRLLSASTPTAEKTELRQPGSNEPSETKAAAAFLIAAGKDLDMSRKGPRLVLTGVKKRLHAYDEFKMTLVFEKAGRMVVDVMVEEASTDEPHKH